MIVTLLGDFWWLSVLTTLTVSLDLTFLKISAKRFLVIPKRNSPEIIFQKQNLHQESSCFKTASIYLFIYGLNIFRSKSISRLQVKVKGKLLSLPHQKYQAIPDENFIRNLGNLYHRVFQKFTLDVVCYRLHLNLSCFFKDNN